MLPLIAPPIKKPALIALQIKNETPLRSDAEVTMIFLAIAKVLIPGMKMVIRVDREKASRR